MRDVARRLHNAERTAEAIGQSISRTRPRIRQLEEDARRATDTVRSVREPARRIGEAAEGIDRQGLRSRELPDYHAPAEDRQ